MRQLQKPTSIARDAYFTCTSGVADQEFRTRLEKCFQEFEDAANQYINNAESMSLFMIYAIDDSTTQIVIGDLTNEELIKLYKQYMVPAKKPARKIYDEIIVRADGRCPFCAIGHVSTLDHYLPKTKYPIFSILPVNLVPSCMDCNKNKGSFVLLGAEEQTLHPYFDDIIFYRDKWISAQVLRTEPVSLEFFVTPPDDWNEISKKRAKTHFTKFNLSYKYSIEAADEVAILNDQRNTYWKSSTGDFSQYLASVATSSPFVNHWKSVMYSALADDIWFLSL